MDRTFDRRLLVAWVVVVGITLTYLGIDNAAGVPGALGASSVVTTVAVCLALVKVRIIMREFMAVRHAPRILCLLTDVWVVLMGAAMLVTYAVGRAVA